MQIIANIPKELNDLTVLDQNQLLLAADDAVYLVDFNKKGGRNIRLREIFRWTGTEIISIDAFNDRIVAGTRKGVIIFEDNKASPVWVGYPCNVYAGKFSEKIDVICLAKPPHKMSRILDVFIFSSSEVVNGFVKNLRGIEEEIVYFSTSEGPIQDFAFNRLKNLTVKTDIDGDGYLELILITPEREPKLSVIDIVDDSLNRKEYDLPAFTGNPILLDYRDINHDGENELYVVSMLSDFEAVISVIMLGSNKVSASIITKIDVRELFGSKVSDDGLLYLFIGQFDDDELPEIIGVWEEPSDQDGFVSKLMIFKIDLIGRRIVEKRKSFEEITIKRILAADIDSDECLELVIFNESGASIYKVRTSSRTISLMKIIEFRLPLTLKFIHKEGDYLIVGGPLSTRQESLWSLLRVDLSSKEMDVIGIFQQLVDVRIKDETYAILTKSNELVLVNEQGRRVLKNILDLNLIDNDLFVIIRKKGIFNIEGETRSQRIRKKKILSYPFDRAIFILNKVLEGNLIVLLNDNKIMKYNIRSGSVRELNLDPSNKIGKVHKGFVIKNRDSLGFLLISDKKLLVANQLGKIVFETDLLLDDARNTYPIMSQKDEQSNLMFLFIRKGELYKVDPFSGREEKLNLDNISAMDVQTDSMKLVVAFNNNWVVEYDLNEVIYTES